MKRENNRRDFGDHKKKKIVILWPSRPLMAGMAETNDDTSAARLVLALYNDDRTNYSEIIGGPNTRTQKYNMLLLNCVYTTRR